VLLLYVIIVISFIEAVQYTVLYLFLFVRFQILSCLKLEFVM